MDGVPKQPSPGALVRSQRRDLSWVQDDRLHELEYKEPATAIGLGLVTGGGGFAYTGDYKRAATGVAVFAASIAIAGVIGGPGILLSLGVGAWGALGSWRQARRINRFLRTQRIAEADVHGIDPSQRLLASIGSRQAQLEPAPTALVKSAASEEFSELIERLHKLAQIRASGVIDDAEFRSRKIDALQDVASARDDRSTEALLFALLPLFDAGVVSEEDMAFVKELGT